MAAYAASASVFLGDAAKPRVDGFPTHGVELWACTGDGASTPLPIVSKYGDSIISGTLAGCSYAVSGTNNTTITFTPTAATDLVNTKVYLAVLITKPVGT